MNLDPVRELAADKAAAIHGIPATVTRRPWESPVVTRIVWGREIPEDQPIGREYERREPKRVMAIRRTVFADIPRGTVVLAIHPLGGSATQWKVVGMDRVTRSHFHVVVIPVTTQV